MEIVACIQNSIEKLRVNNCTSQTKGIKYLLMERNSYKIALRTESKPEIENADKKTAAAFQN